MAGLQQHRIKPLNLFGREEQLKGNCVTGHYAKERGKIWDGSRDNFRCMEHTASQGASEKEVR